MLYHIRDNNFIVVEMDYVYVVKIGVRLPYVECEFEEEGEYEIVVRQRCEEG